MKVVDADSIRWRVVTAHRSGSDEVSDDYIKFKHLLQGDDAQANNYELALAQVVGSPPVPRHRHNFEQFRYALSGMYSYAPGYRIEQGLLGYFPEGGWYGPECAENNPVLLTLQFGGASGCGFMSVDQQQAASYRLQQRGVFDKGTYRGPDYRGQDVEQDGFEAVWEEAFKRPMSYPEPRYPAPVLMHPRNFQWRPYEPGVERKVLGLFSEGGAGASMLRLQAQAVLKRPPDQLTVMYVLSGELEAGGKAVRANSAIELQPREKSALTARAETDILVFSLPDV